jgi:GIY-YIG catalytic domain
MAKRSNISTTDFPTEAGVYIVWEASSDTRPLYVGVAATQTIEQRWRRQHLLNRAGGSALRRSLGTHLGLVDRKLSVSRDGRFYAPEVEQAITDHLRSCEIEFVPAASTEHARELEAQLIEELRPLLNKRRRPRVRRTLAEKDILRNAKRLYEERVKRALTSGLLAVNPTAELDPRTGYVLDVVDNLLPGVDLASLHAEFHAGAGRELEAKMRAPWSSSALAVNSFAP